MSLLLRVCVINFLLVRGTDTLHSPLHIFSLSPIYHSQVGTWWPYSKRDAPCEFLHHPHFLQLTKECSLEITQAWALVTRHHLLQPSPLMLSQEKKGSNIKSSEPCFV